MAKKESKLLLEVRRALAHAGDKKAAPIMQAYMKSTMPYHGVKATPMRAIAKEAFKELKFASREAWQDEVLALWRGAKFREERYAAIALSKHRAAKSFRTIDALPLYEELIVTGAWWDVVDEVASHLVGPLLDGDDAKAAARAMRTWSKCDDMWKQRTSIICQVSRQDRVDTKLLEDCIAPSIARKEFFLRKAIGWALRSYAWENPTWVTRYVKAHDAELSGLSKREALKNISKA